MNRVVNAVYFDVYEDGDGDWQLRWSSAAEDSAIHGRIAGHIYSDGETVLFGPYGDDFAFEFSDLAELAGLMRLFGKASA